MKHRRLDAVRKAATVAFQRPNSEPVNVFKTGLTALQNDDVDAAIKSASRLFILGSLHNQALAHKLNGHLSSAILAKQLRQSRFAFQGPRPSSALTAQALEGLFDNLLHQLSHLQEVRTDYPCDYMARCKAAFTDALIHELESSGHHSPAFDRLIQLRDAWDCGHLDLPNVTETQP
ncbi:MULTISPECIES: hypothetical protein [unclassified Marinobacter]|uniref:hypothetical protein n=1 Tax=unclassified Marinobacter TaxID=83889 RepID=UPI0019253632|nr:MULTISPECIES: hypothetical protein [unclassified Marinobacter]MBL3826568.1 hypothetical protein [Marinobacter sp. MC3]MBL3894915.1 hypothetical protein [Marinobacter sp. MW3]